MAKPGNRLRKAGDQQTAWSRPQARDDPTLGERGWAEPLAGAGGATAPQFPQSLAPLTLDGDDVLPDLVLQRQVLDALDQVVDGVDIGMHGLEALDLCPDGRRIGERELLGRPTGQLLRRAAAAPGPGPRATELPAAPCAAAAPRSRQARLLLRALPTARLEVHGSGAAGARGWPGQRLGRRCGGGGGRARGAGGAGTTE